MFQLPLSPPPSPPRSLGSPRLFGKKKQLIIIYKLRLIKKQERGVFHYLLQYSQRIYRATDKVLQNNCSAITTKMLEKHI